MAHWRPASCMSPFATTSSIAILSESGLRASRRSRRLASLYWPDRVERITGVPERQIVDAAHILGEAATAMVLSGRGAEQQSQGVNNVLAFINLVLALGQAGKPFSGYGCFTGQGNGQGGREHGQKADQLPGYRKIADPRHRADGRGRLGCRPRNTAETGDVGLRDLRCCGFRRLRARHDGFRVQRRRVRTRRRASAPQSR